MPRGDRTGPEGYGPMTGGGLGYCGAHDRPGRFADRPRWGMGGGFGRGWARRRMHRDVGPPYGQYRAAETGPTGQERMQFLKEHAERLREEADAIEKEIEDMRADEGENDL